MRILRTALLVLGAAGIIWGGWLLVSTQRPDQWLSALIWLAAAVIINDAVILPTLSFIRRRRAQTAPRR